MIEPTLTFRFLGLVLAILGLRADAAAQRLDALRVGHWVEVRGKLVEPWVFDAEAVVVLPPAEEHVLIGTVERLDVDQRIFHVLGQPVHVSPRTVIDKQLVLAELEGVRVKVTGHHRGPAKFSARGVAPRGSGRDRIAGRIDAIEVVRGVDGAIQRYDLSILSYTARLAITAKLENETDFAPEKLAPAIDYENASGVEVSDDEDVVRGNLRLSDVFFFGGQLEYKGEHEENFDVDDSQNRDRDKQRASIRLQLTWRPSDHFRMLGSPRLEWDDERENGGPDDSTIQPHWNELYAQWTDAFGFGVDATLGRQRFDDGREFVYKQNLDGIRLARAWENARIELSWTTVVHDGNDRDEHTDNWIAYLSNNDRERHLAAYVVDRRDDRSPRDYPLLFGVRAVGEFVPDVKSWAEVSMCRGYSSNVNLRGFAFDLGATWKPDPWRFTAGYAFATGDDPDTTNTDEGFQQTGLQRNNDKVGGATSVRYYGELIDPELSNLGLLTLGIGYELARKTTIELLWHAYRQDEAANSLRDTNLDSAPNGNARDLGQELDLVFGTKALSGWEFEAVFGRFEPGDAFTSGDPAWLAVLQARFQF